MGMPVVTVAAGGLPVVESTVGGTPVTEAVNKFGVAVTKVAALGLPVVFESSGFATFDGTPSSGSIVVSNGNLTVTHVTSGAAGIVFSTLAKSTGKYYFELTNTVKTAGTAHSLGIAWPTATSAEVASGTKCVTAEPATATFIFSNNVDQTKNLGTAVSNDVYCFAIDLTTRLAWVRRNAGGLWNAPDAASNPATGTGGLTIGTGSFAPAIYLSTGANVDSVTANFGASAFAGAVPSGFTGGWPA